MDKELEEMMVQNTKLLEKNTRDLALVKKMPLTSENREKLAALENDRELLLESEKALQKLMQMPSDRELNTKLQDVLSKFHSPEATPNIHTRGLLLSDKQSKGPSLTARAGNLTTHHPHFKGSKPFSPPKPRQQ